MIVVAGESLVDLILSPGGAMEPVPGGGPFNVARTIARLGQPVAFLGCVSDDRFGRRLRAALVDDGVDVSLVASTGAPTTLAVAELDERGTATYRFYLAGTAAAAVDDAHLGRVMPGSPEALHVGTLGLVMEPVGTSLQRLVARLDAGTLLMVDPNCRPAVIVDPAGYRRRLDAILARADVVKVSADDLAYLEPGVAPSVAARRLRAGTLAVILVTDGGAPVEVVHAGGALEVPVPAVEVVDTVGSGDAFGGAFLAWWRGRGLGRESLAEIPLLLEAVAFAVEVAAITCGRPGADPPRLTEMVARA